MRAVPLVLLLAACGGGMTPTFETAMVHTPDSQVGDPQAGAAAVRDPRPATVQTATFQGRTAHPNAEVQTATFAVG